MHSNSDIDEDERGLLSNRRKEDVDPETTIRRDNSKVWLACAVCLLIGIALGTYFNNVTASRASSCKAQESSSENGNIKVNDTKLGKGSPKNDMHSMSFPIDIPIIFQPNTYFTNSSDPELESTWEQLLPVGRGFIQLDSQGKPVHNNGEPSDKSQTKIVSVFHQLHCLNTLRKSIDTAMTNPDAFYYVTPKLSPHWANCIEYLRQVLMCNSEMTFESLRSEESRNGDVDRSLLAEVDGWGTEHQCRNFGKIHKWAEMHRVTEDEFANS
ncbi:hypothetical protein B0J11DRAFT_604388 [Dendryphion nanum]|uniref:Uncharacterized protein n=1 Tax=Dendryphion nanum TaxID=256645 RepID=A0A9P9IN37_9PLEO|nr:hypothetical protein B0J11DRAFT_604388 [Dendryphion nanum]